MGIHSNEKVPPLGSTEALHEDGPANAEKARIWKTDLERHFEEVRIVETENLSESELHNSSTETSYKIVKLVTMVVVFLVLLSATVVSKVT